VVTRFLSGGLWVLEVWKRQADRWMVEMSNTTTAAAVVLYPTCALAKVGEVIASALAMAAQPRA